MKHRYWLAGLIALVMGGALLMETLGNRRGQGCGRDIEVLHFANEQTAGAPATVLTAEWSFSDPQENCR